MWRGDLRGEGVLNSMSSFCTAADPGFLERGVHLYKGVMVRFADFISFFLNIPRK